MGSCGFMGPKVMLACAKVLPRLLSTVTGRMRSGRGGQSVFDASTNPDHSASCQAKLFGASIVLHTLESIQIHSQRRISEKNFGDTFWDIIYQKCLPHCCGRHFCGGDEIRKPSTTPFVNPCRNGFYCVSLQTTMLGCEQNWAIIGPRF